MRIPPPSSRTTWSSPVQSEAVSAPRAVPEQAPVAAGLSERTEQFISGELARQFFGADQFIQGDFVAGRNSAHQRFSHANAEFFGEVRKLRAELLALKENDGAAAAPLIAMYKEALREQTERSVTVQSSWWVLSPSSRSPLTQGQLKSLAID